MESDVERVKERINIVDVIGQYISLKRAGRNYSARCPFHKERTPSFMVSPERGTYICFGCGEKGDVFSFIQKMDGIEFGEALKQLAEKAGIKLERQVIKNPEAKEYEERIKEVVESAVTFFENELSDRADVEKYISTRGAQKETISTWRIGYAPAQWDALSIYLLSKGFSNKEIVDSGFGVESEKKNAGAERPDESRVFDRFRGRIMFPMFDLAGRPIAVSGRFFEKVKGSKDDIEPAKYVNSPETIIFKKSRVLYGLDRARGFIRKADCILLVEGQFDLIMSHQSGLPFAVALSGTALTAEHLTLLGRLSKRLVLALDNDEAGIRAGLKSAQMAFEAGFDVKVPTFAEGKDPADVAKDNPELLKAAIRTSKTAVEFFMEALRPKAKDERAYIKLVEAKVLPLIAAIHSEIDREHFIALVARKLGVSESAVRAEVGKVPTQPADDSSSPELHSKEAVVLSPLERAVGMLFFAGKSKEWLTSQLGTERLNELEKRMSAHEEVLRFSFDSLLESEDEARAALEVSVERFVIGEKIDETIKQLRVSGDITGRRALLEELQSLKRKQEELRK